MKSCNPIHMSIKKLFWNRHIWVVALLLAVSYCCFADMARFQRLGTWTCLGPFISSGDNPDRYDIDMRGRLFKLDYVNHKVEIISRIPIERCAPIRELEDGLIRVQALSIFW